MSENEPTDNAKNTDVRKTDAKRENETMIITERGRMALRKKYNELEMSDARGITRARLLSRFVNELATKQFGAIVFGYEMTLQDNRAGHTMPLKEINAELEKLLDNGITIGIAPGRDYQTIKTKLQHVILPEYWKNTYIGYHNGSNIKTLDDDYQNDDNKHDGGKNDGGKNDRNLESFLEFATTNNIISKRDIIGEHCQISIKNDNNTYSVEKILHDTRAINSSILKEIKIFKSDGFINIIPYNFSKYHIIDAIKKAIPKNHHILCIGYDGQWPGDDCELLTHRYSLSTNTVSTTASSCWNLLPDGTYGEQGTIAYLKGINIKGDSCFNICI